MIRTIALAALLLSGTAHAQPSGQRAARRANHTPKLRAVIADAIRGRALQRGVP